MKIFSRCVPPIYDLWYYIFFQCCRVSEFEKRYLFFLHRFRHIFKYRGCGYRPGNTVVYCVTSHTVNVKRAGSTFSNSTIQFQLFSTIHYRSRFRVGSLLSPVCARWTCQRMTRVTERFIWYNNFLAFQRLDKMKIFSHSSRTVNDARARDEFLCLPHINRAKIFY